MRWLMFLIFVAQAVAQPVPPSRPIAFAAIPIVITTDGIMPLPPARANLPDWQEPDPTVDPTIPRPPARDQRVLDSIVLALTTPLPSTRPNAPTRLALPRVAAASNPAPPPPTTATAPPAPVPNTPGAACYRELARLNVSFTRLPDTRNANGCGLIGAVEVTAFDGVVLAPPGQLTCQTALSTARWLKDSVRPQARSMLGARLTKIEQWSTYSCRRRPSGRLSEHAFGNAIDVARLLLADGRRLSIDPDWYARGATGRFLKAISRSSCAYFSVVLDPTSDAAHHNHIHLDNGRWRSCPYD